MGGTRLREEKGQATVELAVMLPVAIVVAIVVVNALTNASLSPIRPFR